MACGTPGSGGRASGSREAPWEVLVPAAFAVRAVLDAVSALVAWSTATPPVAGHLVTSVTATGFTIAGGAAVFVGDPATFAPTVHWQAMGT